MNLGDTMVSSDATIRRTRQCGRQTKQEIELYTVVYNTLNIFIYITVISMGKERVDSNLILLLH